MADPLTPAQVEALEELLEEREQRLMEAVDEKITAAVANAIKYGEKIALRADGGMLLCVTSGGPTEPQQPVTWESRPSAGPWESFTAERGQS